MKFVKIKNYTAMDNIITQENFENLDTNLINIFNMNCDIEIFEEFSIDSNEIFYILQSSL